ncbi:hypothetical protein SBF1_700018 [Candidatus Desulfosporosinus infrequens]|uniref:Uncharacterized protein n=1 Tax=Candidatus Desulfosporosinus infrequens TaxID=2043169 RepID=A0A2U3LPI0_9FIRM|nr:hypothetical protein SBF1_700018 [Candidatus Desulfosporosinus infrequens]
MYTASVRSPKLGGQSQKPDMSDWGIPVLISGLCRLTSGEIPPCLTQNIQGIFDLLFPFICLT